MALRPNKKAGTTSLFKALSLKERMEKPMVHMGEVEEKIGNQKSLQGAACHTFLEQVEVAWMLLVFTINVQTVCICG